METKFALRYAGPAVDSGLMNVYEASANMIAFSVTNNYGEVKQVSIGALTVVFSDKGSESAEQFIHKALGKERLGRNRNRRKRQATRPREPG